MEKKIKLAEVETCTGCSVCSDVCPKACINMLSNNEGFLYPSISSDVCISCGKCVSACPALQNTERNDIKKIYAMWMKNGEKIQRSTSGGVFQGLAECVLEKGGVVFGAAFDDEFALLHTQCENTEDLSALLGSKYLQSNTEGIYKVVYDVAELGRDVLFSGTPCQCDALIRYYLARNKSVPDNLLLCELMCHGVPSPGIFKDYMSYLESKKKRKVISYNFRYKKLRGWSVLSECIEYKKGRKDAHRAKYDAWHTWFGRHLSVRKSCYSCKYRDTVRVADITLGDFWSIAREMPELETQNGISAVFVNTEKGQRYLNDCSDQFIMHEIDTEKVEKLFNVPIRKGAVTIPASRKEFFDVYNKGGIPALFKAFPPQNFFTAVIAKLKWMIIKK